VARGLARAAVPDSLQAAARSALGRLLQDVHPHVRIAAVGALASYTALPPDVLQRLIAEDGDANVRVAAAQAATTVFGPDDEAWHRAWRADSSLATRAALLSGAARHGILLGDAPDEPAPWRTHPDPRRRALFVATFVADREEGRAERAATFLADTAPEVGRALAAIFARRDSARPAAIDAWLRRVAISAADPWLRATAVRGAAANGTADVLPTLVAAYRRAEADAVPAARQAALTALAEWWSRDSTVFAPWADSIRRWAAPTDARDIALGMRLPLLSHWGPGRTTVRPLDAWESLVRTIVLPTLRGQPLHATLTMAQGQVVVALAGDVAPSTVANLRDLAARGYFDGVEWHRVVPNFVAQTGDPSGTGNGGPGYTIRDELNRRRYQRGTIGMALSGPDTGGSQWFITLSPQPHLDGGYTVFGHVVAGLEVVDGIAQWDRLMSVRVQ
jgi:cyclophilin family peptidyl-prolyl cis-trans isomerase